MDTFFTCYTLPTYLTHYFTSIASIKLRKGIFQFWKNLFQFQADAEQEKKRISNKNLSKWLRGKYKLSKIMIRFGDQGKITENFYKLCTTIKS